MEMACGQTFRQNEGECGQEELLPGIPDHITIQNIAPKLTWKTSNMMQMVSRGWGHAIRSRDIYNARVISQSTETFLVLRSEEQPKNCILILYSCSYGTHLRLPPIPMTGKIYPYACICMDGRVYVWAAADYWEKFSQRGRTELWVLDLVGERRWTRRGPVRHLMMSQCGVLEGKIYQFGGYIPSGSRPSKLPIHLKVKVVAKAQVYDPQCNIWSTIITPEPLRDVDTASGADLERKLASFSEWARQELSQAGPLPIVGPYEPFYSDWRSRLSTNLACNNDAFYRNGMALQVYHKSQDRMLNLFFIGGKLVRLGQRPGRACFDLEAFDTQKETWEHWQCFQAPCDDVIWCAVFAENVIWALVSRSSTKAVLVRSSSFLGGEAGRYSAGWIDTTCSVGHYGLLDVFVRSIYL